MSPQQITNAKHRRHPRAAANIKTDYRFVPPERGKKWLKTQSLSLGSGGLMFYSDHPIEVGTYLEMRLFLEAEPIELTAKVVWVERQPLTEKPNPVYKIGLQFEIVTQGDFAKIDKYALSEVQLKPPLPTRSRPK